MRKLKTSDVPAFCRCLKKLGLKDRVRELAQNTNDIRDAWAKGFDLLWDIFDAATEVEGEKELYRFLAGPFEMTAQEVEDLPLPDMLDKVKQLAKENDLACFFKFAARSTK